jgi:hypothetical protein
MPGSFRTPGLVVAALAALALTAPGAGAASAAPLDLRGPAVVRYAHTGAPGGATRRVVTGSRLPNGGCTFPLTLHRAAGAAAVSVHELAYDPSACLSLVAIGGVTAAAALPTGTIDAAVRAVGPRGVQAAAVTSNWHAWFQDPPGIHVNDVTNGATWSPNATCAFPAGSTASFSRNYQWLTATGWSLQDNNWQTSAACSGVVSSSQAHFHNTPFCAFLPTDTYYNRNVLTGLAGGGSTGSTTYSKSGACAGLLSFHAQFA